MYTATFNHGAEAMRYQKFLCDTLDDVLSLPTASDKVAIGSEATCLEDNTIYILNNARHWIPFRVLADGHNGGDASAPIVDQGLVGFAILDE